MGLTEGTRWRVVCAAHGVDPLHRTHTAPCSSWEEGNRLTSVMDRAEGCLTVAYEACVPWHVEAQVVTEWLDPETADAVRRAWHSS